MSLIHSLLNRQGMPLNSARFATQRDQHRWVSKQALNAAWFNGQVRSDYPWYPSGNRKCFSLSLSLSSNLNNYHSNILNTAENHPNISIIIIYFKYLQKSWKITKLFHFFNIPKSVSPCFTQALRHRGRIRIDDLGGVPAHGRTRLWSGGDEIHRDEWREYTTLVYFGNGCWLIDGIYHQLQSCSHVFLFS